MVGLHASADPQIIPVERCMYLDLRPSLIKVLTFHPPEHIYKLAVTQPNATWIVRIFFKWEGRVGLDSQYFIESVVGDTRRTLNALAGRSVILEIHNEPNLTPEGWSLSWANGAEFSAFVSPVIEALRREFPSVPLMFPAVSPGGAIEGIRYPHTTFLEEARPAVEACDALGVHFYWAAGDPLESAIGQLDTYINQFPSKPLWITEASYLSGDLSDADIAAQYLRFIELVRARPAIRGVVFFVASALDPTFGNEVWLGKNIAPIVGNR